MGLIFIRLSDDFYMLIPNILFVLFFLRRGEESGVLLWLGYFCLHFLVSDIVERDVILISL